MENDPSPNQALKRAAQYLRASTEHQRYSTANQADAIRAYALLNGYEIVRTYADEGISGVSIKHRKALQQLLTDVLSGENDFETVIVYDISRWGRFQNPDQAAHYEFLCADAGAPVTYCGERFANDGSLSSTILKTVRRVMAAEYSRDLSTKVTAAKRRAFQLGYWQWGAAGYGFRRQTVDKAGRRGLLLEYGQQSAIVGHHTIIVPGPEHEIRVVRRIFRLFAVTKLPVPEIRDTLNSEGTLTASGRAWSSYGVRSVLRNPAYIGEHVGFRTRGPLGQRRIKVDESDWVRVPGACEALIGRKLFDAAQQRLKNDRERVPRDEMIAHARRVFDQHGTLNWKLVTQAADAPSVQRFQYHFRNLHGLCAAVGCPCDEPLRKRRIRVSVSEALRLLTDLHRRAGYLDLDLLATQTNMPSAQTYGRYFGSIANAFMLAGFVSQSPEELRSPVGRARVRAARARARAILAAPPA